MITLENHAIEEIGNHTFSCFASDVDEFRKGFPKSVKTNIGNGRPFIAHSKKVNSNGDIERVRYIQEFGCVTLVVYND